jgi:hypothetical protein
MNSFQVVYSLALLALIVPAWGRQRFAWAWLMGNLVAMLAASLAMDLGLLSGHDARVAMMSIDLATGVGLAMRPGLPRVIAAGYAVTVPLYFPLISGLFTRAESAFTVIYIVAALQIGALCLGSFDSHSGGGGGRRASVRLPLALSRRGAPVSGRTISPATLQGQEME